MGEFNLVGNEHRVSNEDGSRIFVVSDFRLVYDVDRTSHRPVFLEYRATSHVRPGQNYSLRGHIPFLSRLGI